MRKPVMPANDNDLLLLSVQRNATRFTQRMLGNFKIKAQQIHPVETRRDQLEGWMLKNSREQRPIIVPLRHPISVAKSWVARSEPGEPAGFQIEQMFKQYELLFEFAEISDTLWLPVDHPERNGYIAIMSMRLKLHFSTNWKPYGARPVDRQPVLSTDTQFQINELLMHPLLSDIYTQEVPHGT